MIIANKNKLLTKVGEQVNIYLYDNGFMVEVSGKDLNDDWKTVKHVCLNENELFETIRKYITMERE